MHPIKVGGMMFIADGDREVKNVDVEKQTGGKRTRASARVYAVYRAEPETGATTVKCSTAGERLLSV